MYKVLLLNKIAEAGLKLFPRGKYETGTEIKNPDAILVRSTDMLNMNIPESVSAIARAGAGYNNIPVEACSERGVVVFNTPGANANAVKELVITALLLSSRKIIDSINWLSSAAAKNQGLDGAAFSEAVEKSKNNFTGPEIKGKTLGVVGLGAIGVMVANDASALGMKVIGYDPFISVDAAWSLSRTVERCDTLEALLKKADYVTIHVPFNDNTKNLFNREHIFLMKKGARLINLARGALAHESDVISALDSGVISRYITDFPTAPLIAHKKVLCFPHLGASTPEAELNCAVNAVNEIMNFLETGAIKNSVNYPPCRLEAQGRPRLLVANKNIPNMVGQITTALAENGINITDLINHHKGNYAFNIIDTNNKITKPVIERIKKIEGVLRVRVAS